MSNHRRNRSATREIEDSDVQSASALETAQDAQDEQAALVDSAPSETQYSTYLAAYVAAKHDQVARIEERLEHLLEQQTATLQRLQSRQPGFLSLPQTRAAWQQQLQLQTQRIERLHERIETVREIRDGMTLHGPRIEQLAARKLRAHEPELSAEWDKAMARERRDQAQAIREAIEARRTSAGHRSGLGLRQGVAVAPSGQ